MQTYWAAAPLVHRGATAPAAQWTQPNPVRTGAAALGQWSSGPFARTLLCVVKCSLVELLVVGG
ncbi:hypothetical protein ACFSJD_20815, partial [Pseudonocardia yunnanensis]